MLIFLEPISGISLKKLISLKGRKSIRNISFILKITNISAIFDNNGETYRSGCQ